MFRAFSHIYWHRKEQFLLPEDRYHDAWVMFAMEDGRFRFRIGDAQGEAGPGDLVLCPPGAAFGREAIAPVSFHFFRFDPADPRELLRADPGLVPVRHPQRLASTLALLRTSDPAPSDRVKAHLLADLLLLCVGDADAEPPEAGAADPLMRDAREWIRAQACDAAFRIERAAELAKLTPVQFSRRFQAAFGLTAIRFLTDCRIARAKRLLAATDDTLERIAERCGYENGFYLSRVFKQQTGTSPSEYRRAHRV